ncbi:helix-turn-helix transcriptional regulator [Streptococcus parauberis]|uniref:DNA-binding helix-turn-helix protein n=1 Tax=Streptococcus parauberis NCFD 2020 TaxID=873447 RepID=F1Z0E9_9STRE|nr:helix-turn-helix transcriptional regulator [Streptococcus parauberis]EGE54668.1 DNA-binding helix-turn-helix protein [Streptococcus parauberis NCFD 2020]
MKNNLQELRKEGKISQSDLAEQVGVTRQTIISLEKGRYNASLELAFKLSKYFHVGIEDIFIYEEEGLEND